MIIPDMYEAFVYLWYDALNKMYYLGKHKGTPDDTYTHSSSVWESFTKETIPEGASRRILAYGTHEEICILENKLLVNRFKRCWNRYYNGSLGDPSYVDQSGENNPMYKDGSCIGYRDNPEVRRAYGSKWQKTPKGKEVHNRAQKKYGLKLKEETGFIRGKSYAKPNSNYTTRKDFSKMTWKEIKEHKRLQHNKDNNKYRARLKLETGYSHGRSTAGERLVKKNIDNQAQGTLEQFL